MLRSMTGARTADGYNLDPVLQIKGGLAAFELILTKRTGSGDGDAFTETNPDMSFALPGSIAGNRRASPA